MNTQQEVWALTDGRAGNEAQALGLARALLRRRSGRIEVKRIALNRWAALLPAALSWRLGVRSGGWPFSGVAEGFATLHRPWPKLIVSAGRRSAVLTAALRKVYGIPAVQILDPKLPAEVFDALIIPAHDRKRGPNVLPCTGALSGPTLLEIREAGDRFVDRVATLAKPRLAVLIGGPSRSAGFSERTGRDLLNALEQLAMTHSLMITPSRRTPAGLRARLRDLPGFVWDGAGDNPYPGLLAHAEAVLVTADSVNMSAEAASTGLPVHIFPIDRLAGKLQRFHQSLAVQGAARPFSGQIDAWSYEPLAEADRIAGELVARTLW